jgi:hypothetical protein
MSKINMFVAVYEMYCAGLLECSGLHVSRLPVNGCAACPGFKPVSVFVEMAKLVSFGLLVVCAK